jgi:AraC-like DNA-binding protein/ligand-binding sensor protein
MASAPGIEFLPVEEQQLYAQEFQKDVEFIQLLILLVSKSCATGSVDITWVDVQDGVRQVIGTTQAAGSSCSRYLQWTRKDPSQRFCNIVSDYGRRAAESCGVCENAAEKRVGKSGHAQVYRCHAGLTDIAVPVISGGRLVATLYSGQVLTKPPSKTDFEHIAEDISHLTYVDLGELEKAYWEVPVVSEEEIENTVNILEVLAEYLGRFWKRLEETVKAERERVRASQLAAKEFAYGILRPETEDRARLCQLMKQLGFVQPPNRVLVVELQREEEFDAPSTSFDLVFTTALHAMEELTEKNRNMAVAYLRRAGVCVFFRDYTEGPSAGLAAHSLAEKILYEISSRCNIRARIGIGGIKPEWRHLAESYHEASLALARSQQAIALCSEPVPGLSALTSQVEKACRLLADQRIQEARLTIRALPMLANQRLGNSALAGQRTLFSSALESLCLTALKAGCEAENIARLRTCAQSELARAAAVYDVQATFLETAEAVAEDIRRLLSSKHEKIIARVRQMLDRRLKDGRHTDRMSLAGAARALGVSTGHLSRLFRRMTGSTFRDYVMCRRVEHARRLLLDPLNNVSTVAVRCGFATPTYFARVFRKIVGCAPSEYVKNPQMARAGARRRPARAEQRPKC